MTGVPGMSQPSAFDAMRVIAARRGLTLNAYVVGVLNRCGTIAAAAPRLEPPVSAARLKQWLGEHRAEIACATVWKELG